MVLKSSMLEKGEGTRNSSWDIVVKTTGAFNFENTIKTEMLDYLKKQGELVSGVVKYLK
ncbi:hypothetical protein CCYN74_520004 [Capnocytophaga cynodegmi]|uniref:Uncharacterized protein n=2 Tax=Capnocytophaga cynodegmi TaxID=28189 RepID=A0A0B7HUB3_9FLAO|nr:hypothetical protein CCYN74_520004 [Capnocytophaga cynodegmi]